MLNVNELESQWLKYKIKSYIPYGIIIFSSVVAIVIFISFTNLQENAKENLKKSDIKKTIVQSNTKDKDIAKEKPAQPAQPEQT